MNKPERKSLIASYGSAFEALTQALERYPTEMWQWQPGPGQWSIHEIIVHLADSEANSYLRCRRLIAEPGSGVYGYDENRWAQALDYHRQSTSDAIELFRMLRKMSYQLIMEMPDEVLERASILHSENGLMSFDEWLQTYEAHVPVHLRQMERNYQQWLNL